MKSSAKTIREFFAAAHAGEVEKVVRMLQQDPSLVEAEDEQCFQYRALNIAVWRDNRPLVDALLEAGSDIDAFDSFEPGPWNALQHALNYNHLEMAEYLVERGATIDVHSAAGLPRMQQLRLLLNSDPSLIQARGGDGKMPLHFAANPEVAAFLLERGAEIDARDMDHFSTPAQWAADHRNDVSRFLVSRGAQPDIFMAVCSGDVNWVREMVEDDSGVLQERIDEKRFPGPSLGEFCCIYRYTQGMGANATPLHVAAGRNLPHIARFLLQSGMDPDLRGGYDDGTPLHFAAWNGQVEMIDLLLDSGAGIDLNSGDLHRNSPLGWAVVSGAVAAVERLLQRGARVARHHFKDARHGAGGDFRNYTQAPPEDFRRIHELLMSTGT